MKTCRLCSEEKNTSEFYTNRAVCKKCFLKRQSEYQKTEAGRDVAKRAREKYRATEHGRRKEKEYRESEAGQAAQRKGKRRFKRKNPDKYKEYQSRYYERFPEKLAAKKALRSAVRYGKIEKPCSCEQCGDSGVIHGHHEDYSKPLDVKWLCPSCHVAEHARA